MNSKATDTAGRESNLLRLLKSATPSLAHVATVATHLKTEGREYHIDDDPLDLVGDIFTLSEGEALREFWVVTREVCDWDVVWDLYFHLTLDGDYDQERIDEHEELGEEIWGITYDRTLDLVSALDSLGEPFPDVHACLQSGQTIVELEASTRAALKDAL